MGCILNILWTKSIRPLSLVHAYPARSNPFFNTSSKPESPYPSTCCCFTQMRWLSRPATPNSPKLTIERPSAATTLDFKLSHKGNPDSISTIMLPNDHISKTKGTSLRSSTRMLLSVVNLFAKNDYISGGRYSGVLEANCCWCSTVWPSGFKRKLEPRSIIFRDTIFCYS